MAKRRLTQKQVRRIANNKKNLIREETADDLGNTQSGLVISHFGRQLIIEDTNGLNHQCKLRQNLGNIACGDRVLFQADESNESHHGVVVAIDERDNLLEKTGFGGKAKPVAANIDQVIIVCAVEPEPNHYLIDRYIVATENLPATPVIVLNKVDVDTDKAKQLEAELDAVYGKIGYRVIATSATEGTGFSELDETLKDRTSIFVGLSGVGKSSLVKILLPDEEIRIGDTSKATGEGKHTTTVSSLYHLDNDGDIIDSPGVRDFTPNNTDSSEIEHGFIELRRFQGSCKFSNCGHDKEPGCAINQALTDGKVLKSRVDSFKKMLSELED